MSSIGGSASNHFGSPHSDVLSVTINDASTAEQRETLYTELQRRSKAAVQAMQWYDAVTLYTKAIECCGSNNGDSDDVTYLHTLPLTKATLYANISLCLGKMNRWTEAVMNAQQSVEIDATYMKGWYRLGQAQAMEKAYSHAISAFEKAISLDPNNTVLQKELEKCKVALVAKEKEDAESETKDVATTTTKVSTKIVSDDDIEIKVMDQKTNKDKDIMDDSTNNEFTKSDYVRGYKIVNGKKTSYFHNELSEDAKKLIGDIAPKKIDPTDTSMAVTSTSDTTNEGKSVWNKAGTWEEKDCTTWATETITDMLTKVSYTLPSSSPAPNAVISIPKVVVQPSSHASFATVRTKKRYIYELDITVHWNFVHNEISASGTMRFPDIDGTCVVGDGYEATAFVIVQIDDATLQPVLTQFCYNQGLRLSIHETIDNWVRLFKDTY